MVGNVSYYKIILCVTLTNVKEKEKKSREMSTKKQSNYEKFDKVNKSINQSSAYENRKLLQHERLGRYESVQRMF